MTHNKQLHGNCLTRFFVLCSAETSNKIFPKCCLNCVFEYRVYTYRYPRLQRKAYKL